MKTLEMTAVHNTVTTALKPLVNQLLKNALPFAVHNRSLLINDIPEVFDITADKNLVTKTLGGILTTFITYASDSCIRISAERILGNLVQINVRDNNNNHSYAVACALQKIVPMTEKCGGRINITNRKQRITTISFIFPVLSEEQVHLHRLRGAA